MVHTYRGHRETPTPTILGHEILGQIEAFGEGRPPADHQGVRLETGDRITWSIAASCGACFYCSHGIPQKCESLFKYGHEEMRTRHQLSGGLAEYCQLAAGTAMVRVPDSLSDRVACPANCATATVAAALRASPGGRAPETVLVQGAGMLGLTACAMVRSRGANIVIAADIDGTRLDLAEEFGATHCVDVSVGKDALGHMVGELTEGRGIDLALELSGSSAAVAEGLAALRLGGRQVLVGSVFPSDAVAIQPESIVRGLKSIHGVHNYTPQDLVDAVAFLDRHHRDFPFDSLVRGSFPLREVSAAFDEAIRSRAPRVMVGAGS